MTLTKLRAAAMTAGLLLGAAGAAACSGPAATATTPAADTAAASAGMKPAASTAAAAPVDLQVPTLAELCATVPLDQLTPLVGHADTLSVTPTQPRGALFLVCNLTVPAATWEESVQGGIYLNRPSAFRSSVDEELEFLDPDENGISRSVPGFRVVSQPTVDGHRALYTVTDGPGASNVTRRLIIDVGPDLTMGVLLDVDEQARMDIDDPAPLVTVASTMLTALREQQAQTTATAPVAGTGPARTSDGDSVVPLLPRAELCAAVPLDQIAALFDGVGQLITRPGLDYDDARSCRVDARSSDEKVGLFSAVLVANTESVSVDGVIDWIRSAQPGHPEQLTELDVAGHRAVHIENRSETPSAYDEQELHVDVRPGLTLVLFLPIAPAEPATEVDPAVMAQIAETILSKL